MPPPSQTEAEISIFGPGFGESIVVHIGQGEWIIVDSCIDVETDEPQALRYLQSLGVNVHTAVRYVVATHWHDDHIRGLSDVFKECHSAKFITSAALQSEEMLTVIYAYKRGEMVTTGADELSGILAEVGRRRRAVGQNQVLMPCELATADQRILQRPSGATVACEIWALSPSAASLAIASARMADLATQLTGKKKRLPRLNPNDASMALWISIGNVNVLLGADLEEIENDSTRGWSCVLSSGGRPQSTASVFKVPHHGSQNGHNADVWQRMLDPNPFCLITPFVHGSVSLPQSSDAARILSASDNAFVTASPVSKKSKHPSKTVDKMMKSVARNMHPVYDQQGQIRLRRDVFAAASTPWTCEMFGDASHLAQMRTS